MENHHFSWVNPRTKWQFNSFLYVYQRVSVGIGEEPRCFLMSKRFKNPLALGGSQAGGPEFHTKIVGKKNDKIHTNQYIYICIYIYVYIYIL